MEVRLGGSRLLMLAPSADADEVDRYFSSPLEEAWREVRLARPDRVLRLEQSWASGEGTGGALWSGGEALARYLASLPEPFWRPRSVIELGAGTGVVSLAAKLLGAREVVLTDGFEPVLRLAERNVTLNLTDEERRGLRVQRLRWGPGGDDARQMLRGRKFDVILAADVAYFEEGLPALLAAVQALCHRKTLVFFANDPHRGEHGPLEQLLRQHFNVQRVEQGAVPELPALDSSEPADIRIYVLSALRPAAEAPAAREAQEAPATDSDSDF